MRNLAQVAILSMAAVLVGYAQDTKVQPQGSQFPGPGVSGGNRDWMGIHLVWPADTDSAFEAWIADLRIWRHERLTRMGYDDAEYRRPELLWTQRNFIQPQSMVEERYFFDPVVGRYTVDRFLDDLDKRYGGIDSVLLWPVYPNIGIDNRNQWDLTRDMPGGIPGLRQMVEDFHHRGVRVFFPSMPWDNGTRDIGVPYWEATAKLMAEIGADGVNGDTFGGLPRAYRVASDATGHPVAFEPEGAPQEDGMLAYNNQSWGYWNYPFAPLVSKLKWLEPRHMIHVCDRWAYDHTDNLQAAFFNGVGFESWENIWGIWNQMTPRDAEALRRISRIYRAFPDLLVSMDWTPHVPTLQYGVYASRFPASGHTLWTIVNRNEFDIRDEPIRVEHKQGRRYYDVWNGVELTPRVDGGRAELSLTLEEHGFGAVMAVDAGAQAGNLPGLLAQMHTWAARPLESYSKEWQFLPQRIVEIAPTAPAASAPAGMVRIPGGAFEFNVSGIEIEGSDMKGVDIQYPWEDSPRRGHRHRLTMPAFYIDKYPVTNAEFRRFVEAAHYHPADDHNFLRHWVNGAPRAGEEDNPVTWVSLEDARAYAKWAGKRLPHEWEWQYAAQASDGRLYPWGNAWDDAAAPAPYKGRDLPPPARVGTHPKGASSFGVEDLTGNVWQWTDEYVDEHTRAAILRGASFYQPQNSIWYFPQAYRLSEHGKYLLMAPSKDRAGTLGFRCVVDAGQ
jgi:formylglycine-generating enzyme required for sulfatase activity